MLQFWKDLGADPPVKASGEFFSGALRSLVRLSVEEGLRWATNPTHVRAFVDRAREIARPVCDRIYERFGLLPARSRR